MADEICRRWHEACVFHARPPPSPARTSIFSGESMNRSIALVIILGIIGGIVGFSVCYWIWLSPIDEVKSLVDNAYVEIDYKDAAFKFAKAATLMHNVKDRYKILVMSRAYQYAIYLRDELASAAIFARRNMVKDALVAKQHAYIIMGQLRGEIVSSPIFLPANIAVASPFIIVAIVVATHARKVNKSTSIQKLQASNENTSCNRGL